MRSAEAIPKPLTGKTVLFAFIAFFTAIFAVNGVFLSFALSTDTGIVAIEPYRKGLKYNERIAADEQQAELGWTSEISFDANMGKLVTVLKDRNGKPLTGLTATVLFGRATSNREDVTANLAEVGPGHYEAAIPVRELGGYVANVQVSDPGSAAGGVVYRARRRIWLKP